MRLVNFHRTQTTKKHWIQGQRQACKGAALKGVMGQGDIAEQQPREPAGEAMNTAQGSKGKVYRKGKVKVYDSSSHLATVEKYEPQV